MQPLKTRLFSVKENVDIISFAIILQLRFHLFRTPGRSTPIKARTYDESIIIIFDSSADAFTIVFQRISIPTVVSMLHDNFCGSVNIRLLPRMNVECTAIRPDVCLRYFCVSKCPHTMCEIMCICLRVIRITMYCVQRAA